MHKRTNQPNGFTFIEIILVIGILLAISTVTTPLFARFLARNHLETTTGTVVSYIRKAQENAMDGKNDATWGVCITGGTPKILRLYSSTCTAPIIKNDFTIPASITINGLTDTTFSKGRGEPQSALTITVSSDFGNKTITVNAAGGMAAESVSPVGYWKFDEGSGDTAYDASPQGNNGNLGGADACPGGASCPTWTNDGKFGKALTFDNVNDFVEVSDNDSLDVVDGADLTITAWVRIPLLVDNNTIVAKKYGTGEGSQGYQLYINSSGQVAFYASDGSVGGQVYIFSTSTISAGSWYHIAAVYDDDSGVRLYINDVPAGGSLSGTLLNVNSLANPLPLRIGSESDGDLPFSGDIDEVKVYNYALY